MRTDVPFRGDFLRDSALAEQGAGMLRSHTTERVVSARCADQERGRGVGVEEQSVIGEKGRGVQASKQAEMTEYTRREDAQGYTRLPPLALLLCPVTATALTTPPAFVVL